MGLFSKTIKKALRSTGRKFLTAMQRNQGNHRFDSNAYYITMGTLLCSMTPYYGWRNARRAAKKFDRRAFIMRGATVNRHIENIQWSGHKNAWNLMTKGA